MRILLTGFFAMLTVWIAGCQTTLPSTTVVEYRPAIGPVESRAPFSDVYVLWKWVPEQSAAKKKSASINNVVRQIPVQVIMTYAPRGAPVGFRRSDGQLIALAGGTTQPLVEAHYTWQTLSGETQHMDDADDQVPDDSSETDDDDSPVVEFVFDLLGDLISSSLDGDHDDGGYDHHSGKSREHHSHDHPRKPHSPVEPKKKPTSQP